ncbi:hypothetical protein L1F30_14485 [Simiduia sp. 21SJ11W-1]|uniref:hypothetical protein n=1 Tax=Simiduia sp. 21SJ11W-1 TaxID=2909669 RepID=UPI00209F4509|nr:hypothetical protein [Simiduia sp. 21SJ11W-1]UTA47357.1 hypothetical protein L1F30_14485 [Simiduia sp. 21SJ11W-1]
MNYFRTLWLFCAMALTTQATHASLLDFASDAHTHEKGHATLSYSGAWGNLNITAHANNDDDNTQFAYMDANYGGLGACKDIDTNAQCAPGNDDNVNTGEWLTFVFDRDVRISNLWVNNNHDGGFASGASLWVGGQQLQVKESGSLLGNYHAANSIGSFLVAANTAVTLAYHNTQFYVTALEITGLPEGGSIVLLIIGIIGLVIVRHRT